MSGGGCRRYGREEHHAVRFHGLALQRRARRPTMIPPFTTSPFTTSIRNSIRNVFLHGTTFKKLAGLILDLRSTPYPIPARFCMMDKPPTNRILNGLIGVYPIPATEGTGRGVANRRGNLLPQTMRRACTALHALRALNNKGTCAPQFKPRLTFWLHRFGVLGHCPAAAGAPYS